MARRRWLLFQKLGGSGGFDLAVLNQFGFENVERSMRTFPSGARDQRCADGDGLAEPDGQLRGHGAHVVCKQAVRHDSVEEGGGDATVQDAGVALERRLTREDGLDAAIGAQFRTQLQTDRVRGTAHDAVRMFLPASFAKRCDVWLSGHAGNRAVSD